MKRVSLSLIILLIAALVVQLCASAAEPPSHLLELARAAKARYDFEEASAKYNAYFAALNKAKMPADSVAERERQSLTRLRAALENVEDVVIIDSVYVAFVQDNDSIAANPDYGASLDAILSAVSLPGNVGKLIGASQLEFIEDPTLVCGPVFINADGNTALYSARGANGMYMLYESNRLADGSWQSEPLTDIPAPAYAPFMLDDGMTLYYTSDNHSTLGGRDVMMSVRDAITEPWREPRNLGMPFNSPADELLYVVDTQDSIGWLVTMRNNPDGGGATVYRFLPSDTRRNIESDDDGYLRSRARIASIADTWPDDFDVESAISGGVNGVDADHLHAEEIDFDFLLPDGRRVYSYSQLGDSRARSAMQEYMKLQTQVSDAESELEDMYEDYAAGERRAETVDAIKAKEVKLDYLRADAQRKRNKVFRLLGFK